MASAFLKVLIVAALTAAVVANICDPIVSQATCNAIAECKYRVNVGKCVLNGGVHYIWIRANEVTYSQLRLRSGWTLNESTAPSNIFHGPQLQIVADVKVVVPPSLTVAENPSIGKLVPWDSNTVHYRDQQPPLVQPAGTFAYLYTPTDNVYPKLDMFEYYFDNGTDSLWGEVRLTIAPENAALDAEDYKCKDTYGGTLGSNAWNGPYSFGSVNHCYANATNSDSRPWITRHFLPRIWSEITNANIDDDIINRGNIIDDVEFRWMNNALNITGHGRLGQQGQRIYGFQNFKFEDSTVSANPWTMNVAGSMPQTMSFDKSCVATQSSISPNGWGNVFRSLPDVESDTVPAGNSQCSSWNHQYLCANAPLLTVEQGMIKKNSDNSNSIHDQPWSSLIDGCHIWTTGLFKWDLMLNYCKNGKYGNCASNGGNVFQFTNNGDWVVKFDFFNTGIQPASQIDTAAQKARGWLEINHKYEVTLTLASRLDFAFETGIDIFTVDVQWFRYESNLASNAFGFDRGLGINLVVFPEGYDSAYPPTNPRHDTVDTYKVYHNNVPKKVMSFNFYANPTDVTADRTGGDANHRPVGLPAPYLSDPMGWSGQTNHLIVHPCRPEASGNTPTPATSCDYQNLTARIRMPHNNNTDFTWDGRLVFQFTLNNGEHPNFILDTNYKQTAKSVEGTFDGRSATCRTYPKLIEVEVKQRDPSVVYPGVGKAAESLCAQYNNNQAACGPSARESNGYIVNDTNGVAYGCAWNYYRQACLPQYSVTCQEPNAHVFGPTDRSVVLFDITDVDSSCVEVHKVWFKWTSGGITHQVYAVFPQSETLPVIPGVQVDYLFPNFEFLQFQPLSALERNMPPMPVQTNLWDYGFVFEPGTINDNVNLQMTAQVRITSTCAKKSQNTRFRTLQQKDQEMEFGEEMKLSQTAVSVAPSSVVATNQYRAGHSSVTYNEGGSSQVTIQVDHTPLYITLGAVFAAIVAAVGIAVVVVRRSRRELKRLPSASGVGDINASS